MRTIEKTIYKLEELDEKAQEKAHEDFVQNDDCQLILEEAIDTLKEATEHFGGKLVDYQISIIPDRGEYIKIDAPTELDEDEKEELKERLQKAQNKDCPFTGVCYDESFIEGFQYAYENDEDLKTCLKEGAEKLLEDIHKEGEHRMEFDFFKEEAEELDMEFYEDGTRV